MKIVIDIPEDLYNHVKHMYRYGIGTKAGVDLGFAVAKGTLYKDEKIMISNNKKSQSDIHEFMAMYNLGLI